LTESHAYLVFFTPFGQTHARIFANYLLKFIKFNSYQYLAELTH